MANEKERGKDDCCAPGSSCGPEGRREFLKFVGGGSLAFVAGRLLPVAGPFGPAREGDHFVPADKRLAPEWKKLLFERGGPTWYSGRDLETIAMPVGGIGAGTVYLTGDGRLAAFDVMNAKFNTGYGAVSYQAGRKPGDGVIDNRITPRAPAFEGFCLGVTRDGGKESVKSLDMAGFPKVRFNGEYPIGTVDFGEELLGIRVRLAAYSPFIPLDADDSGLPATILEYTLMNRGESAAVVRLEGLLENFVLREVSAGYPYLVKRTGSVLPGKNGILLGAEINAKGTDDPAGAKPNRPPIAFESFDGTNYGKWRATGEAFGAAPARGTLKGQNPVTGFDGAGLVNTYLGGDDATGRLESPPFTIERRFISFLVGGGAHTNTCIELLIGGVAVRRRSGKNGEHLEIENWDVRDFAGKEAVLRIVDERKGPWGHINIDRIEFRDDPRIDGDIALAPDMGTLAIACVSPAAEIVTAATNVPGSADRPAASVAAIRTLAAGEEATFRFVVAWHFPNNRFAGRLVGQAYARRFANAGDVIAYVADHADDLARRTRLWHDLYYATTLPRWLLDRVHSTVANLATTTAEWWRNGRFWAWEGGGCCHGTCGHVWNYALAPARLFPELERSVREMQDFAPGKGFDTKTGAIMFRGEGFNIWAGDAQGGYVMRAWREHLMSADDSFLNRNWEAIKKATEFLIREDADEDGLIESPQHQTYDEWYHGANTYVGAFYLGALRAAAAMADRVGDAEFAARCRTIADRGAGNSMKRLFNGEYFIQDVDLTKHPDWQYKDGCLADQLLGQNLAQELGLGRLYPERAVKSALAAVWKYNWAPDTGPQNKAHDPERWFAYPGEAGLFTCTWPKSKHLGPRSTRYRDEIWTGIEHQVAAHMIAEGMIEEGLAIERAIHERYHPSKRNPWNEVECGDHYARAMASWGVLTALAGFRYDGPRGALTFLPRFRTGDFQTVFTGAEGFGLIARSVSATEAKTTIVVHDGRLRLRRITVAGPNGRPPVAVIARPGASGGLGSESSLPAEAPNDELDPSTATFVFRKDILLEPRPGADTLVIRIPV